jgi:hypothetical protein
MTYPSFTAGEVLRAADMNAVGLWLVKTQTVGTGVSSVTVTGAFSADYDNYRIIYDGGAHSTSASINLQLGSTTSGYYFAYVFNQFSATAVVGGGSTTGSNFDSVGRGSVNGNNLSCDLYGPFLSKRTGCRYLGMDYAAAGFNIGGTGFLNDTTSYTAFTMTTPSGTMTGGTIAVYGYKK